MHISHSLIDIKKKTMQLKNFNLPKIHVTKYLQFSSATYFSHKFILDSFCFENGNTLIPCNLMGIFTDSALIKWILDVERVPLRGIRHFIFHFY